MTSPARKRTKVSIPTTTSPFDDLFVRGNPRGRRTLSCRPFLVSRLGNRGSAQRDVTSTPQAWNVSRRSPMATSDRGASGRMAPPWVWRCVGLGTSDFRRRVWGLLWCLARFSPGTHEPRRRLPCRPPCGCVRRSLHTRSGDRLYDELPGRSVSRRYCQDQVLHPHESDDEGLQHPCPYTQLMPLRRPRSVTHRHAGRTRSQEDASRCGRAFHCVV